MRHVIIGNSAAAIGCVEGIRKVDKDSSITIVADEPHHTYSRPLISYLLGGLVDESRMAYRPLDFYEKHRVETLLGVEVTHVNPQGRTVSARPRCARIGGIPAARRGARGCKAGRGGRPGRRVRR